MKLDEALETLDSFYELEDDWQGADSLAPLNATIDNALAVYGLLKPSESIDITANPNGTITYEWSNPDKYVQLEIGVDGAALMVSPTDKTIPPTFRSYIAIRWKISHIAEDLNSHI